MSIQNNRLSNEQYQENFADIRPPFENKTAAVVEANRCLFCYDAPCTKSCPTHIDVPKFIKQITTDNVKGSAHTILESYIMGAGCSTGCQYGSHCIDLWRKRCWQRSLLANHSRAFFKKT